MNVKMISVDTTSHYFHNLTDALNTEVTSWLNCNSDIKLISVTPNHSNVINDDENVVVMTATIIYE